MSEEGRVTLAEAVQDIALAEVTPPPGKGALGRWRVFWVGTDRTLNRDTRCDSIQEAEPEV
jgi:hypothetical protein